MAAHRFATLEQLSTLDRTPLISDFFSRSAQA